MPEPRRVKVEGDLFHPRIPEGAVYVGRSGPRRPASKFANPFRLKLQLDHAHPLRKYVDAAVFEVIRVDVSAVAFVQVGSAAVAVDAYERYLRDRPDLIRAARDELRGRDLACWCKPPIPCHVVPLLGVANA